MTIKTWFLEKNYTHDEIEYGINLNDPTIEKETEKALLLKWNTEYGVIKGWFPKSVVIMDAEPETANTVALEVNDKVNHKTFGEGVITAIAQVGNDYLYTVKFAKKTANLMGRVANLTKVA